MKKTKTTTMLGIIGIGIIALAIIAYGATTTAQDTRLPPATQQDQEAMGTMMTSMQSMMGRMEGMMEQCNSMMGGDQEGMMSESEMMGNSGMMGNKGETGIMQKPAGMSQEEHESHHRTG